MDLKLTLGKTELTLTFRRGVTLDVWSYATIRRGPISWACGITW